MRLGPLGKDGLLGDEAVAAIRGALVKQVLSALVPAPHLIVVVWHLPVPFRP